jgi:hypothetical protein
MRDGPNCSTLLPRHREVWERFHLLAASHRGESKVRMEYLFLGLLVIMLLVVWYAKMQRGVVRTMSVLPPVPDEEEMETG